MAKTSNRKIRMKTPQTKVGEKCKEYDVIDHTADAYLKYGFKFASKEEEKKYTDYKANKRAFDRELGF